MTALPPLQPLCVCQNSCSLLWDMWCYFQPPRCAQCAAAADLIWAPGDAVSGMENGPGSISSCGCVHLGFSHLPGYSVWDFLFVYFCFNSDSSAWPQAVSWFVTVLLRHLYHSWNSFVLEDSLEQLEQRELGWLTLGIELIIFLLRHQAQWIISLSGRANLVGLLWCCCALSPVLIPM